MSQNLFDALNHVRDTSVERTFWIDAICINQNEKEKTKPEKTRQLSFMTDIYMIASHVTVWLGNAENDSEVFFKRAPEFAKKDIFVNFPTMTEAERMSLFAENWGAPEHYALIKIAERDWWRRVWCVQEVAVAKGVILHCGDDQVSWDIFAQVMDKLGVAYKWSIQQGLDNGDMTLVKANKRVEPLLHLRKTWATSDDRLTHLVSRFREWHSTDPRDKVFALRGVARTVDRFTQQQDSVHIEADFQMTESQVYGQMIVSAIQETKLLDVLSRNHEMDSDQVHPLDRSPEHRPHYMPSWIIGWASRKSLTHPLVDTQKDVALYKASGNMGLTMMADGDYQVLQVNGLEVDSIEIQTDRLFPTKWPSYNGIHAFFSGVYSWSNWNKPNPYHTLQGFEEAVHKSMIADVIQDTRIPPDQFQGLWDQWKDIPDPASYPPLDGVWGSPAQFSVAIAQAFTYRRFFRSTKGYVGLVPYWAEEGDLICILFGGQTPYVLRPFEGGYIFVGDCYDHGIMNGEALLGVDISSTMKFFPLI